MKAEDRAHLGGTNCVEISESRIRLAFLLIGVVVLVLGSLLIVTLCTGAYLGLFGSAPGTPGDLPWLMGGDLIGTLGIVFFGAIGIQIARRLCEVFGAVVILSADGFKDRRISPQLIPWAAILSVSDPWGGHGGRGFFVEVDPKFAATIQVSRASRLVATGNRLMGYRGFWVVTGSLKSLADGTLLDKMRERLNGRVQDGR